MFLCHLCRYECISNEHLLRHVRNTHPMLGAYRCSESHCYRSFSSYNSFAKHRNRDHKSLFIESQACENNEIDESSSSQTASVKKSLECQKSPEITKRNSDFSSSSDNDEGSVSCDDFRTVGNSPRCKEKKVPETFNNLLDTQAADLVAKLYSISDVPRKRVQNLIEDVTLFFGNPVEELRRLVFSRLEALEESEENLAIFRQMFTQLQQPFEKLNSEYHRFKYFEMKGTFIRPVHSIIGYRDESREEGNQQILIKMPVSVEFIPISLVFKKFFELPKVYSDTMKYLDFLNNESGIITNFVQGDYWKKKVEKSGGRTLLPIILYFDDYETNNPLGSHRGIAKCGAVYLTIPCLPPTYRSKLENIFLFMLFNTIDRSIFQNPVIFRQAIVELTHLETEGIQIRYRGENKRIYFKLAAISGDNLGLHSILGFVESFRANFFCRFCLTTYNKINEVTSEAQCSLRNVDNYQAGLLLDNMSSTGIKENCVFHELPDFHVTENISVDVMHDFLEGVCQYDLANVLHFFIVVLKLFSLYEFNSMVNSFHFSKHDRRNKTPELLEAHLKSKKYGMSSAEMLCLVRNLTMIIGHLVPDDCEHWKLIVSLKRIAQFLTAKSFQKECSDFVNCLITEHLELLCELFPGCLKPKHHFMVHYPRIMQLAGPLWNMASMRCESKHRESKITARVSISRVNICRTLALKHQLKLNWRLMKHAQYPEFESSTVKCVDISKIPDYEKIRKIFPPNVIDANISKITWLRYFDNEITRDSIIMIPRENGPSFYIVIHLFLEATRKVLAITHLVDCFYNAHFDAFKIASIRNNYKCITGAQLRSGSVTYKTRLGDGNEYVAKNFI